MTELQLAPTKRIIKNAGVRRVRDDAVKYLNEVLETEGASIAAKANKLLFADENGYYVID